MRTWASPKQQVQQPQVVFWKLPKTNLLYCFSLCMVGSLAYVRWNPKPNRSFYLWQTSFLINLLQKAEITKSQTLLCVFKKDLPWLHQKSYNIEFFISTYSILTTYRKEEKKTNSWVYIAYFFLMVITYSQSHFPLRPASYHLFLLFN